MEQETRGASRAVPAAVRAAAVGAAADVGAAAADALNSWAAQPADWPTRVDRLEAIVDRLGLAQEQIRRDHRHLWRWADEDVAPTLRFLTAADAELGAQHERPRGLRPLFIRVQALEIGLAEVAHELQRACAALELLCSLSEDRPK